MADHNRRREYEKIMEATEYDQQKLYNLIRKQRGGKGPADVEIDFSSHNVPQDESECNRLTKYYEDLATPKDHPEFGSFYERSTRLQQLIISTSHDEPSPSVNRTQVLKDIMQLKNNKEPDIYRFISEHLKHADMEQLLPIMMEITKKCFNSGEMPEVFKVGVVTPVSTKEGQACN